jgi:hypothetical protein
MQAVSAIAAAQFRHPGILHAAHDWLLQQHASVPPSALVTLLPALHSFGMASSRLCDRAARSLVAGLPALGPADKGALADVVWTLGARHNAGTYAATLDATLRHLAGLGGPGGLPPKHLGRLARGLAGSSSAAVAAAVAEAATAAAAALRRRAIAGPPLVDTLAGVAASGYKDEALLRAAAGPIALAAGRLSVKELCDVAAAYSQLDCVEPRLFAAIAPAVQSHTAEGLLSAEHAATLAWAFALQGMLHGPQLPSLCWTAAVRTRPCPA